MRLSHQKMATENQTVKCQVCQVLPVFIYTLWREPDDEDGNAKNALLAAIYSPIEQTTCEETIKIRWKKVVF